MFQAVSVICGTIRSSYILVTDVKAICLNIPPTTDDFTADHVPGYLCRRLYQRIILSPLDAILPESLHDKVLAKASNCSTQRAEVIVKVILYLQANRRSNPPTGCDALNRVVAVSRKVTVIVCKRSRRVVAIMVRAWQNTAAVHETSRTRVQGYVTYTKGKMIVISQYIKTITQFFRVTVVAGIYNAFNHLRYLIRQTTALISNLVNDDNAQIGQEPQVNANQPMVAPPETAYPTTLALLRPLALFVYIYSVSAAGMTWYLSVHLAHQALQLLVREL